MTRYCALVLLLVTACDGSMNSPGSGTDGGSDAAREDGGSVDGGAMDATAFDASSNVDTFVPAVDDGLHPRLLNFRVEAGNVDRVYFDSSEAIGGSSPEGFIVSGSTITELTVLPNQSSGHYLTMSEPFTFWDNNTIRFEGGSDIVDADGNSVFEFDLHNIENLIPEPEADTDRFVSVSATGGGDGSLGDEWTIVEAGMNAVAGQTVHIAAGDYGPAQVVVFNSGTADNPIKFIGYGSTPGDNPELDWSYPDNTGFDSAVMPLLNGGDELADTRGFETRGSYIIVKNIQIQEYQRLLFIQRPASFVVVDNVLVNRGIYGFLLDSESGEHNRITNSLVYQTQTTGFRLYGNFNRIENCRVYDDRDDGDEFLFTGLLPGAEGREQYRSQRLLGAVWQHDPHGAWTVDEGERGTRDRAQSCGEF